MASTLIDSCTKTPNLQQPATIAMKTAVLALLFLFAISTTLPSVTADAVIDTDGDLVLNRGGSYYFITKSGRGLELAQLSNDSNPVSVIQSGPASNGLPLNLATPALIPHLISTSFPLNINFVGIKNGFWEVLGGLVKVYKLREQFGPFKLETYKIGQYLILYYDSDNKTYTPLRVSTSSDAYLNTIEGDLLIVKFKKAPQPRLSIV